MEKGIVVEFNGVKITFEEAEKANKFIIELLQTTGKIGY